MSSEEFLPTVLSGKSTSELLEVMRRVPEERPVQGWAGEWIDACGWMGWHGGKNFNRLFADVGVGIDHIRNVIRDQARLTVAQAESLILGLTNNKKLEEQKAIPRNAALFLRIEKDKEYDALQKKIAAQQAPPPPPENTDIKDDKQQEEEREDDPEEELPEEELADTPSLLPDVETYEVLNTVPATRPQSGYLGEWLQAAFSLAGDKLVMPELVQKAQTYKSIIEEAKNGNIALTRGAAVRIAAYFGLKAGSPAYNAIRMRARKEREYCRENTSVKNALAIELGAVTREVPFMQVMLKLLEGYPQLYPRRALSKHFELHPDFVMSFMADAKGREDVDHTFSQASIERMKNMAKILSCDFAERDTLDWAEEVLQDVGYKRYSSRSLDTMVEHFFAGTSDHTRTITDHAFTMMSRQRQNVDEEARALAAELSQIVQKEWGIASGVKFVQAIGLPSTSHYEAFFKFSTITHGVQADALKGLRNNDGTPVNDNTRYLMSSLINGNPTIPPLRDIIDDACHLMEMCQINAKRMPQNNILMKWMHILQHENPGGNFILNHTRPNLYRIPNAVVDIIVEKYGFRITDVWPTIDSIIGGMRKGARDVATGEKGKDMPGTAKAFAAPFAFDKDLQERLRLLLLLVPYKKEPAQLLVEVTEEGRDIASAARQIRLQRGLTISEYARELCGADSAKARYYADGISRIENGNVLAKVEVVEELAANWFGREEENKELAEQACLKMLSPKVIKAGYKHGSWVQSVGGKPRQADKD